MGRFQFSVILTSAATFACAGSMVLSLRSATARSHAPSTITAISLTHEDPANSPDSPLDFNRDIAPILGRTCMGCHSGDAPRGGLNLESRDNALRGGRSGKPAIVPGRAAQSRLIQFASGTVPDLRMPPQGAMLEPEKIALLSRWIDEGASWGPVGPDGKPLEHWHWAYRPIRRHDLPRVNDPTWPRNFVDHFVLARLESENLRPSPEASRPTLIRRLSLDLVGLPPTPEEVDAFVADSGPDAYQRLVDRLLDSPHYGERWARLWLDLSRYADTNGYEKDARRSMWPWRDWVIDAFNRDMPFDQFTVEQLAGDLLPQPGIDQVVATGFNRNTMTNEEGGTDVEEFRVDAVFDRVDTVSTIWLGSTIGCARCHDHKFDPIRQVDYFRLFAFFNQDRADAEVFDFTEKRAGGAMVTQARLDQRAEFSRLTGLIRELEARYRLDAPELDAGQKRWEEDRRAEMLAWSPLVFLHASAASGAALTPQPADGSILASGAIPDRDTYTLEAQIPADVSLAGLRLEVLPDSSLGGNGPGRADNGNFVLSDIRASLVDAQTEQPVALSGPVADHEQRNYGSGEAYLVEHAIDGDPARTGWAIGPRQGEMHAAHFSLSLPPAPSPRLLRLTLAQQWGGQHTIGRFRFLTTSTATVAASTPLPGNTLVVIQKPAGSRSVEESAALREMYRAVAPETLSIRTELADLRAQLARLTVGTTLVMAANDQRRTSHLLIKGNFLTPGDEVQPDVPPILPPMAAGQRHDRLGFAHWLVDERNPLTARVTVNRWWEQLFGRGIVETSEDFGTQGDAPSHPELLEELAARFMEEGWSLKELCRMIVTSATYRQSSTVSLDLWERDPANRFLARGARFRLEAEMIRDNALAISGLLHPALGGPSVFPPQPPGIWTMIYNSDQWVNSTGPDRYRRGLYTFWRRTAPYPTFTTFDAPSREITCTRRARTNTPLQALITLNDPQFVEAAGALALRVRNEAGSQTRQQLARAFRLCVSHDPDAAQIDLLLRFFEMERSHFATDADGTRTYLRSVFADGLHLREVEKIMSEDSAAADLAAMALTCNVLLNMDETLTRE